MTKIIKLEPKIKVFKSREVEAFENIQKLIKLYQSGTIDSNGELIEDND